MLSKCASDKLYSMRQTERSDVVLYLDDAAVNLHTLQYGPCALASSL